MERGGSTKEVGARTHVIVPEHGIGQRLEGAVATRLPRRSQGVTLAAIDNGGLDTEVLAAQRIPDLVGEGR